MRVKSALIFGATAFFLVVAVAVFGLAASGRDRNGGAAPVTARPGSSASPASAPSSGGVTASPGVTGSVTGSGEAPGFAGVIGSAGVTKGRRLRDSGPLTVRQKGAVIEGLRVHTEINVAADDVTIRDVHLLGAGEWGIIQRKGFGGLRVENVQINGDGVHKLQFGILNQGGTLNVRRAYIHTVSDGVGTDHGTIEDSVVSGLKEFPHDHVVAIASNGPPAPGLALLIRRNVLLNSLGQTSALSIYQDFGPARDVTVEGNLLAGGGYTLYGGKGRFGPSINIKIINNVFSRRYFRQGGAYGPVTAFERGRGNQWRGNRWEDGTPVLP